MTLLVRDEMDIIEQHLAYHRPKVDFMVVTDNGSVDGTKEFLEALRGPDLILIDEPEHNYQQSKWVTRMINIAKEHGADWVVNSDADEFWYGDIRNEVLIAREHNSIFTETYQFWPTYLDDEREQQFARKLVWRSAEPDKWPKVMNSTQDFKFIHNGNDDVEFHTRKIKKKAQFCTIFHFSHRSWEHRKRKYINGGKAIEESRKTDNPCPSDWMTSYNSYKKEGLDALMAIYKKNYFVGEEKFFAKNLVQDTRLKDEITGNLRQLIQKNCV